ncbi:MAG: DUF1538 domain-containing protein [Clostridia bacterium]|nr:DUF1538 domain-containing protein [Clostridia bacterium]
MNEKLKEKINESLSSVLPITLIVLALSVTLVPMEIGTLALFLVGAVLLIVGMGFFQLGAEMSITPLGKGIGSSMIKMKKLPFILIICFLMGVIITIAEPDLQVLANQVASVPNSILIYTVAIGVGVYLVIAFLRIYKKVSLSKILTVFYLIVFALSFLAPNSFIPVAFDSGGVTTGPMTVPFIMTLGVGFAAVRSDKDSANDSFGLIALCSIGPILSVLLLGIFYNPGEALYHSTELTPVVSTTDVANVFYKELPHYVKEVCISIVPVVCVFAIFQIFTRSYRPMQAGRMLIGFVYTIIGLVMFLTGVNVGFAPVGNLLGETLGNGEYKLLLIPIGALVGYFIVKAEPAVQVLNAQVDEITGGIVSHKMMNTALSIGVSGAVVLSMVRVITGLNIYWILIPGYAIALLLSHRVPSVFVGIAFDSGGVASGPMTSTFLLPLAMGACMGVGGNVITDAFGVVAMVALSPLITIQLMGLIYARKTKAVSIPAKKVPDEIVELEDEQ